jgi:hypothetical protein
MSIALMSACFKVPCTLPEFAVLIVLANFADDEGNNVFPSKSTVARMAHTTERTVQRACADFVRRGILVAVQKRSNRPTIYRLNLDAMTDCHPDGESLRPTVTRLRHTVTPHPVSVSPHPDQLSPNPSDIREDDPGIKPSLSKLPRSAFENAWLAFVAAYPQRGPGCDRNVAKGREKFKQLARSGVALDVLVDGAGRYAECCRVAGTFGTEKVKMITTWLNGRWWEEDVDLKATTAPVKRRSHPEKGHDFAAELRWFVDGEMMPAAWSPTQDTGLDTLQQSPALLKIVNGKVTDELFNEREWREENKRSL